MISLSSIRSPHKHQSADIRSDRKQTNILGICGNRKKCKSDPGNDPGPLHAFMCLAFLIRTLYLSALTVGQGISPCRRNQKLRSRTVPPVWNFTTPQSIYYMILFGNENYSMMSITTPEPTVLPPSRIAKRRPFSIAMGVIRATVISTLSPGLHISTPSGREITPVTSVVLK